MLVIKQQEYQMCIIIYMNGGKVLQIGNILMNMKVTWKENLHGQQKGK